MELGLTGKCEEVLDRVELPVTGVLPPWLGGSLLRNGPGTFDVPLAKGGTFTVPHWFDGLTQLHAFEIADGRVSYHSRHLYPELEQHISKYGEYATFAGLDPCQGVFSALFTRLLRALHLAPPSAAKDSTGKPVMNVGVTIGPVGGKLKSKTDANILVDIEPHSLSRGPLHSYADINPAFKGFLSAAHGQRDEASRTYYNFAVDIARDRAMDALFNVFAIPDDEPAGHLLATIRADFAYVHSFAMTERYLVLMVWPLLLNPLKLAIFGAPGKAMEWKPERGTLFYVVDKQKGGGGHVATYKSDAFFCFHTINAYEEGGSLHIDLCAHDDHSFLDAFRLPHLRSGKATMPKAEVRRYTLPDIAAAIAAGPSSVQHAQQAVLASSGTPGGCHSYELPRINKAYAMQPYQFVYMAAAASRESPFLDAIAKVDVQAGSTQLWRQEACFPGEPIFVARPGGQREDDGLLLSVVLSGLEKRSFLLVLDAASLQEVARVAVPHVIGFGFHGNLLMPDGTTTDLA